MRIMECREGFLLSFQPSDGVFSFCLQRPDNDFVAPVWMGGSSQPLKLSVKPAGDLCSKHRQHSRAFHFWRAKKQTCVLVRVHARAHSVCWCNICSTAVVERKFTQVSGFKGFWAIFIVKKQQFKFIFDILFLDFVLLNYYCTNWE